MSNWNATMPPGSPKDNFCESYHPSQLLTIDILSGGRVLWEIPEDSWPHEPQELQEGSLQSDFLRALLGDHSTSDSRWPRKYILNSLWALLNFTKWQALSLESPDTVFHAHRSLFLSRTCSWAWHSVLVSHSLHCILAAKAILTNLALIVPTHCCQELLNSR